MWFAQIESPVRLTRELGGQRVRVSILELQVGRLHGALQGAKAHVRVDIRAKQMSRRPHANRFSNIMRANHFFFFFFYAYQHLQRVCAPRTHHPHTLVNARPQDSPRCRRVTVDWLLNSYLWAALTQHLHFLLFYILRLFLGHIRPLPAHSPAARNGQPCCNLESANPKTCCHSVNEILPSEAEKRAGG